MKNLICSSMWQVGVDEAGRGPVLGPLVVTAFSLPKPDVVLLEERGITDSKKIKPKERQEMFEWIIENSKSRGWEYHIYTSTPAEIDHAMSLESLNQHEVNIFSHCISKLNCSEKGGTVFLDACDVNAERFGSNVRSQISKWIDSGAWKIESMHGADEMFAVVGAASILAKVTRDLSIEEIERKIGFPIGSGYPSDPVTQKALPLLLEGEKPHDELRWKWATVENAWEKKGLGTLPPRKPSGEFSLKPQQRTLWDR